MPHREPGSRPNDVESSTDEPVYKTEYGRMFACTIEDALEAPLLKRLRGKVKLLFTSPPFPLVKKKRYGNETGDRYLKWLASLAPRLAELLTDDGSLVLEIGNAWERGMPVMSTLPIEALLAFKRAAGLQLCQHLICHNPARLPGPAAWVTVNRVRLKDSYTHVWWMSRSANPDADNRRVLTPYTDSMRKLLARRSYNDGRRPSGHTISEAGFLMDHGGSIAPSVLPMDVDSDKYPESLLAIAGTSTDSNYTAYCEAIGVEKHPARMQAGLAAFCIEFLTQPNDLVLDPFAGSNTTGFAAERLKRRWLAIEAKPAYAHGSFGRFIAE